MDNQIPSFTNQPISGSLSKAPKKKKNSSMLVVVITIFVIIAAAGFIVIRSRNSNNPTQVPNSNETKVSSTPTPSPIPQVDKQSVKIQVLNGTGTPGQAAAVITALTKAGFNPDNIQADNASDYNHSITTIATKNGFTGIVNDIKSALNPTFDNISVDSAPLDNTGNYDVIITTGGKKYEAPPAASTSATTETPTATPTATLTPTNTPTPT